MLTRGGAGRVVLVVEADREVETARDAIGAAVRGQVACKIASAIWQRS